VTKLIQRMREELVRRNYAETTIRSYLQTMEDFRRFAPKRLDHLGPDEIRKYQVHLLEERKLEVGTVAYRVAALRFFYVKTLKRPAMKEDLPYPHAPKHTRRLPTNFDTGRSLTTNRFGTQPVSLRHAIDDVFGGTAAKRVVPAEGKQHR
jgi:site-specific recombinase XerD